jgi:hypothetical protein
MLNIHANIIFLGISNRTGGKKSEKEEEEENYGV